MKRDRTITVAAIAHGSLFLLTGILAIVEFTGTDPISRVASAQGIALAMGGILIVIAAGLLWSVLRGVIDAPMRLVVAATSGLWAGMVLGGTIGDPGTLAMLIAALHLLFAITWIGILLTSDSPYRPRPVANAKRERQRTNG